VSGTFSRPMSHHLQQEPLQEAMSIPVNT